MVHTISTQYGSPSVFDQDPQDLARFKELIPAIKEYTWVETKV
jgi:hypothetical protein